MRSSPQDEANKGKLNASAEHRSNDQEHNISLQLAVLLQSRQTAVNIVADMSRVGDTTNALRALTDYGLELPGPLPWGEQHGEEGSHPGTSRLVLLIQNKEHVTEEMVLLTPAGYASTCEQKWQYRRMVLPWDRAAGEEYRRVFLAPRRTAGRVILEPNG